MSRSCGRSLRAIDRGVQAALHEDPCNIALVLRTPSDVCFWFGRLGGKPRRLGDHLVRRLLADQRCLGGCRLDALRTDGAEPDSRGSNAAVAAEHDMDGGRDAGKVPDLALELEVRPTGPSSDDGDANLRHDLVRTQSGGERALEEP